MDLALNTKTDSNSVIISSIVPHKDDLNDKANSVNSILNKLCNERNIGYIGHENINVRQHLNKSNLHLNR